MKKQKTSEESNAIPEIPKGMEYDENPDDLTTDYEIQSFPGKGTMPNGEHSRVIGNFLGARIKGSDMSKSGYMVQLVFVCQEDGMDYKFACAGFIFAEILPKMKKFEKYEIAYIGDKPCLPPKNPMKVYTVKVYKK